MYGTRIGSDKNYRLLSENPTIRSEVSNSIILNNIHIADMLLTDRSEVKLIIIYLTINQEKTRHFFILCLSVDFYARKCVNIGIKTLYVGKKCKT